MLEANDNNMSAVEQVIDVLVEHKLTVEQAQDVLSYVLYKIRQTSVVAKSPV